MRANLENRRVSLKDFGPPEVMAGQIGQREKRELELFVSSPADLISFSRGLEDPLSVL
jgi:hypothetical protein